MRKFLTEVVNDTCKKFDNKLYNHCFIFPNNRTARFFNRELIKFRDGEPIILPKQTTINTLFEDRSNLTVADDNQLLFILYNVYRNIDPEIGTFETFYPWGQVLLNDFDDIDKYLVDVDKLFSNISALKEIDVQFDEYTPEQVEIIRAFWINFSNEKGSAYRTNFMKFWNNLAVVYTEYTKTLREAGLAYEGMIYREVYNQSVKTSLSIWNDSDIYVFIGLNALNLAERKTLDLLHKAKKAIFYWDYDIYYSEDDYHQAGYFIRRNIHQFGQELSGTIFNNFSNKNIVTVNTTSDQAQIEYVVAKIEKCYNTDKDIAIVLGNEDITMQLLAMLDSRRINISMGYPLALSKTSMLIDNINTLQQNALFRDNDVIFSTTDVINTLSSVLVTSEFTDLEKLKEKWIKENRSYLKKSDIGKSEIVNLLFDFPKSTESRIIQINAIADKIRELRNNEKSGIDTDFDKILEDFAEKTIRDCLQKLIEQYKLYSIDLDRRVFFKMLMSEISSVEVPFNPNKTAKIHVMGLMETRGLDFDDIYMLSVAEGILPVKNSAQSLIPFNLRTGYGLPTSEHQDAMFAYYFYRSLQRSKNISLLYNSQTDDNGTGEPSRYIQQLKSESGMEITDIVVTPEVSIPFFKERVVNKDDAVMDKLRKMLVSEGKSSPFSPSVLNDYNTCKLKFFYKKVAGILEPDLIADSIDARIFGNIMHKALENIYKDHIGKEITATQIEGFIKNQDLINGVIDSAFAEEWFGVKENRKSEYLGQSIIVRGVIEKYLVQMLTIDIKRAPFTLVNLEQWIDKDIDITVDDEPQKVRIGGYIDRLEMKDNKYYAYDYKTGREERDFKSVESLFSDLSNKKTKAVFQTLAYCMLTKSEYGNNIEVSPGLIYLKTIFSSDFSTELKLGREKVYSYAPFEEEFEERLHNLFEEIFDRNVPFTPTEKTDACTNCIYNSFCKRG